MLRKFMAALFFTVAAASLIHLIGIPGFGTLGFLVWINCINIFLFIAYQHQTHYIRQAWATTVSFMAILLGIIALFRADPLIQAILNLTSISLSLLAYYLFALTHGTVGSMYELLLMPINLFVGIYNGIHHIIVSYSPKIFFPGFTLIIVVLGVLSVFLPDHKFLPTIQQFGIIEVNLVTIVFLVFYMSFLLANVRINNSLHIHINSQLWVEVSRENLVLVWIAILGSLFYQIIRFPYLFLINKTELMAYGFANLESYFYRGFWEFMFVGLVFYLITGISFTVLRFSQEELPLLRYSQIGLLLTLLGFFISANRRWILNVQNQGLNPDTFYILFLMIFCLGLTIVLIVRFIFKKYLGWHVFEFLTIVTCIFLLGVINTDNIYLKFSKKNLLIDKHNHQINLANLSADAVDGWILSFDHAKTSISQFPVQTPQSWNENHKSQIYEAHQILTTLRHNYLYLAMKYGNSQVISEISYIGFTDIKHQEKTLLIQMADANVAEWYAYQKLNKEIAPKELAKLEETSAQILAFVNQRQTTKRN